MQTEDMLRMSLYFIALMIISYLVGDFYRNEKKQAEEKLVEYETVFSDQSSESESEAERH